MSKHEKLVQPAIDNICQCYRDHLLKNSDYYSTEDLQGIIEDSFHVHKDQDETYKDCPEWAMERAEALTDEEIGRNRGK